MIIGWEKVKSHFPGQSNILIKRLSAPYQSVRWEFAKEEKMGDHFTGVEKFVNTAPREFIDLFPYANIDPIRFEVKNEDHLIEILDNRIQMKNAFFYRYKEEMIYIFDRANPKKPIWSVYLNAYKYFGYDINRIMGLVETRIPNQTIDPDGLIYQSYYKQFPDFDQLKRTMVLFLS